jgi:hypothetical protein
MNAQATDRGEQQDNNYDPPDSARGQNVEARNF